MSLRDHPIAIIACCVGTIITILILFLSAVILPTWKESRNTELLIKDNEINELKEKISIFQKENEVLRAKKIPEQDNINVNCDSVIIEYQNEIERLKTEYEKEINKIKEKCSKLSNTDDINLVDNITGVWDLHVKVFACVNENGQKSKQNKTYKIRIKILKTGDIVSGKYIFVTNSICSDAIIKGSVKNNEFDLIIQYTGKCCSDAKMRFKGRLTSASELFGSFEPYDRPPNPRCETWWADISGIKSDISAK